MPKSWAAPALINDEAERADLKAPHPYAPGAVPDEVRPVPDDRGPGPPDRPPDAVRKVAREQQQHPHRYGHERGRQERRQPEPEGEKDGDPEVGAVAHATSLGSGPMGAPENKGHGTSVPC